MILNAEHCVATNKVFSVWANVLYGIVNSWRLKYCRQSIKVSIFKGVVYCWSLLLTCICKIHFQSLPDLPALNLTLATLPTFSAGFLLGVSLASYRPHPSKSRICFLIIYLMYIILCRSSKFVESGLKTYRSGLLRSCVCCVCRLR